MEFHPDHPVGDDAPLGQPSAMWTVEWGQALRGDA
jgi:hypothetical protein